MQKCWVSINDNTMSLVKKKKRQTLAKSDLTASAVAGSHMTTFNYKAVCPSTVTTTVLSKYTMHEDLSFHKNINKT